MLHDTKRLVELARRLAPQSLRIQAQLALLHRKDGTGLQREGAHRSLHRLVTEHCIERGLDENGNPVSSAMPSLKRRWAAEALLQDHKYCWNRLYLAQQSRVERVGGYRPLDRWLKRVTRALHKKHIPVFAATFVRSKDAQAMAFVSGRKSRSPDDEPHCHGMAVDLVHCVLLQLPDEAWSVIHEIGERQAKGLKLKLERPYPDKPWHWQVVNWRDRMVSRDLVERPGRVAGAQLSVSPPGEREMLEQLYGLRDEAGRVRFVDPPEDPPTGKVDGIEFDPDDPTTWEVNLHREEWEPFGSATRAARVSRYDPRGSEVGFSPDNVYFDDDIDGDWDERFR